MVELAHVLSGDIPFFGPRRFDVHLKRTLVAPGANRRGSNEELVITELGQVGTQLDALPHQTIGDETYNCVPMSGIARRDGFTAMGAEHFTTVMTRGVLLDIAALKGVPMLPVDYEITVADLEAALARAGLALERGDAIIINTGWHRHWGRDNAAYVGDSPGIGVAAAEWLVRQDPLLVGADNSSVEVSPNPDRSVSLPVHQIMLVVNGVLLVENLKLDELAARRATEFAFVMQPLKIKGGTGSTVAPTAMF
jgi:kynurenine formamidase